MAKHFDTTIYELSHGAPRGRGGWMFYPAELAQDARDGRLDWDKVVTVSGTYTEAKKGCPAGEWIVLP